MQAEDDTKSGSFKSSQIEENKTSGDVQKPPLHQSDNSNALDAPNIMINAPETNLDLEQNEKSNIATGALAIVPSKRQGGFGFLRKLLLRRKKGRAKGTQSLAKA